MLETAFEALKNYDWGTDLALLAPIEDAVVASHGKPDAVKDLENRLLAALQGELSRDAQDYVCRKLATIGSAAAVPVLARLLVKKENSHMARYALERITAPEAGAALRDALGKVSGDLKIGVIGSLGSRRDTAAIESLGRLISDSDAAVARSATMALGTIGTAAAAAVLQAALGSKGQRSDVTDALLNCAETLLASNNLVDANAIYKSLANDSQSRLVRLAATRGLLACASHNA